METKISCQRAVSLPSFPWCSNQGQALVEFTLTFILLLVVAWIPADFGLAMYTSHIVHNASRDGARIAASDPCLLGGCTAPLNVTQVGNCAVSACLALDNATILHRTARRAQTAMMPDTTVTVGTTGAVATCNLIVSVRVQGTYNYFFYQVLRLFGAHAFSSQNIDRITTMRWEHQC